MCLAALAIGLNDRWPFVLLANRDERFDRPAAPMAWWPARAGETPMLAGTDLSAGGTWLGLSAAGRLALVTNVREPGFALADSPSRGELVPQWLRDGHAVADAAALDRLTATPRNGFNLLLVDLGAPLADPDPAPAARWASNRPQPRQQALGRGVHAVSNAALDTPWPKLVRLRERLQALAGEAGSVQTLQQQGLRALADPSMAEPPHLPATGLPPQRERQLSAAFIRVPDAEGATVYGTRCSTVVVVEQAGPVRRVHVLERSFGARGEPPGDVQHDWLLPQA